MWGILTMLLAMTGVWAMTAEDVGIITSYTRQKHSVSAIIFTTFEQSDARRLAELSSSRSIHFMLKSPSHTTNVTDLLQPSYYPVIVVLYPDCLHIMKQACDERLLWPLHHWLLLDWNTSSLENFFLPLDSHITVAKRDSESDGLFLRDVYHVHRSQPLTVTRPRYWLPSLQLPPEPSRTNYGGIPLPTVVVETTDPEVTRVFKEKLYTQPFKDAFTTEEVGIEKIRHGLYAYHGLSGSYKVISDTYQDHEKCRFKEINMFTSLHLSFTARKSSPYISHIKERTCWLREVGLVDREDKRWFYQKPKCESAVQHFVSVGLQDFYPALVVLAYGMSGSLFLLIVEIVHRKYHAPGYEYYK